MENYGGEETTKRSGSEPIIVQANQDDNDNCDKAISSTIDMYSRPKLTYLELIIEAFKGSKTKNLRTCEIVSLISNRYAFFSSVKNVTQCVFQRLAADKCFKKAYPKIDAWPRWKYVEVDNSTKVRGAVTKGQQHLVKRRISSPQRRRKRIRKPPDYFEGEDWKITKQYRSLRNRMNNDVSNTTREDKQISIPTVELRNKEILKQSLAQQFFGYLRLTFRPPNKPMIKIHEKLKSPRKHAKTKSRRYIDWKPRKYQRSCSTRKYNTRSKVEIGSDVEKLIKPPLDSTKNNKQRTTTNKELAPAILSCHDNYVKESKQETVPITKYKTILPAPKKSPDYSNTDPALEAQIESSKQLPISKPPPNCFRPIPLKPIKPGRSNEITYHENFTKPVTVNYPQSSSRYVEESRQGFVNALNQGRYGMDRYLQPSFNSYYTRNLGDAPCGSQNNIKRQQYQVPCPHGYPDCRHTYNVPMNVPNLSKMPVIQSVFSLREPNTLEFGRLDTTRQEFLNRPTTHFQQGQGHNYYHHTYSRDYIIGYQRGNNEQPNTIDPDNRQFFANNALTTQHFYN